jgi:hypothetical protein
MSFSKHYSFFPLVVIVLSLALAGLIYSTVQKAPPVETTTTVSVGEPVNADEYRDDLVAIVRTFDGRLTASTDDLDRLIAAQTALAGLLELRVPVEFKDLHLGLAMVFSDMENQLESESRDITEPLGRLAELRETYSWLAP